MFVRPYYLDVQIWEDTLNEYGIAEIALNNVHTFTDGTDPDTNTDRGVGGLNGEASFPPRFVGKLDEPVPCFAAGTLIDTPTGPVPVETLEIGSLVMTRDHGAQPVHWIARKLLDAAELTRRSHLHPIRISPGALGDGTPTTDLVVSPQHRVLVRSPIAQRMFGTAEVLVAAKALVGVDGVAVADDIKQVEYVHFLLQQHEVVIANGALTESLYLGPEAIKAIGQKAIDELLSIFPELSDQHDAPTPARPLISVHRAKGLARRHQKNSKGLIGQ
ncbi:hemolysin [Paracoccus tegillarcae]|uniref:Hemolysin n=2 Tax=Paracoccus tegillarcae TaxID=1529068 RepID=A0A2K9EUS9_9RHOB|nr:hemolysin [Paracoccus tegillarcae]